MLAMKAGLLLLILLAVPVLAQPTEKKENQKTIADTTATKNDSTTPSIPGTINVTSVAQSVEKAPNASDSSGQPEQGWWKKLWTDPIATFTGALFLATAALIGTGIIQWWETRESSRRGLRAYLAAAPDWIEHTGPASAVLMKCTVKNYGQTPAYQVRTGAIVDILPYGLPPNYPFRNLLPLAPRQQVLNPGEQININQTRSRVFSLQEFQNAALNNGARFYMYGLVQYVDAFGKKRTTRFCRSAAGGAHVALLGSPGSPDKVDVAYEISEQHNEAD